MLLELDAPLKIAGKKYSFKEIHMDSIMIFFDSFQKMDSRQLKTTFFLEIMLIEEDIQLK